MRLHSIRRGMSCVMKAFVRWVVAVGWHDLRRRIWDSSAGMKFNEHQPTNISFGNHPTDKHKLWPAAAILRHYSHKHHWSHEYVFVFTFLHGKRILLTVSSCLAGSHVECSHDEILCSLGCLSSVWTEMTATKWFPFESRRVQGNGFWRVPIHLCIYRLCPLLGDRRTGPGNPIV